MGTQRSLMSLYYESKLFYRTDPRDIATEKKKRKKRDLNKKRATQKTNKRLFCKWTKTELMRFCFFLFLTGGHSGLFQTGAKDTKLRDNLSLLVSIRGGTPGQARVCENIPRAYFKAKLFTNKNAIILARAFFKPF